MKKILFICPYPYGVAAGQRLKFEPHYSRLREKGYEVKIHSFMHKKLWSKVYKKGYVFTKIFWTLIGFLRRITLIFSLRNYDCVYIFMTVFPFGPPILERMYRFFSKKIIYDLEDDMFIDEPEKEENRIASFFKSKSKYQFLVSSSDHVITSSPFLTKKCEDISKKKHAHFIAPTLEIDRFSEKPIVQDNNEKVVIGWTGTVGSKVFVDEFIPILEKLHDICDFKLMVIGNFEMTHSFLDLEMVQWNAYDEVSQLHNFDIGIYPLPSNDWIGGKSGLKALQYMSIGIPPVCSAVGNVLNFIENDEDGILIYNEDDWLLNLESLVRDKKKRQNMGKKARIKFLKDFSQESIFQQYFDLIES